MSMTTITRAAIRRPNRAWVEIQSDEVHNQILYDGTEVRVYHLIPNMFASTRAPGTLHDMVQMIGDKYGIFVPLSDLVGSTPYENTMEGVTKLTYLGEQDLEDVSCHVLHATQDDMAWQIWIEMGAQPVPRKLVFDFEDDLRFTAWISDWDFAPHLPDVVFKQIPVEGARKIELKELAAE